MPWVVRKPTEMEQVRFASAMLQHLAHSPPYSREPNTVWSPTTVVWVHPHLSPICLQKFEVEKKLVSGKVRSGKGKKKAEKARRRADREAAAIATADADMADAPKATKGLGGSRTQTQRTAGAIETDA